MPRPRAPPGLCQRRPSVGFPARSSLSCAARSPHSEAPGTRCPAWERYGGAAGMLLRPGEADMDRQALIIYLNDIGRHADEMGVDALEALVALQEDLALAIESRGIGEIDGNEIAMDDSEGSLYVYGPDAKAMLQAALPVICRSPLAEGGQVYLRYGEAAASEETFALADLCARRNA